MDGGEKGKFSSVDSRYKKMWEITNNYVRDFLDWDEVWEIVPLGGEENQN